jgi:hypothetical protein
MPFEFKPGERKHPKEYGNSPAKALLDEIQAFTKQHRRHSLRRYAGLETDEEPKEDMEGASAMPGPEDCPACKEGTCDDPEHLGEEERGGLAKLLGEEPGED